jgi:hypothetical protein
MKKIIVAACILTIVLFVFPLSSFAKGGKKGGGDSLVCANKGIIEGIVFDFGDGFTLDFGEQGVAIITSVEVVSSGQELTVVIPPKQFIYSANLSEGSDSEDGLILADAIIIVDDMEVEVELVFMFDFATIFEQFKLKKKDKTDTCEDLLDVTVPKKVDLFFEVTDARMFLGIDDKGEYQFGDPFNLVLVIDKGKPVLVDTFEFTESSTPE